MADDYSGSEHDYSGSEDELPPLSEAAPDLYNITYSRETTIAAIKDYYEFLTKMCVRPACARSQSIVQVYPIPKTLLITLLYLRYMDLGDIATPPEGGWPDMEHIRELGKSDEVIELLRFLPYTRPSGREGEAHGMLISKIVDTLAFRFSPNEYVTQLPASANSKTGPRWLNIFLRSLVRSHLMMSIPFSAKPKETGTTSRHT